MSLTDLKKGKASKAKKKRFTVDEFISDAENYAKGTPNIVSGLSPEDKQQKINLKQVFFDLGGKLLLWCFAFCDCAALRPPKSYNYV